MGTLKKKEVNKFLRQMNGIDYLIIDIRNYPPNWAWLKLANRLISGRKYVAMYSYPNYDYPGYVKYNPNKTYSMIFKISNAKGTNGNNYYEGNVIILINHTTMSHAEYVTMGLRLAPKATVIGTQTAGADGNVSSVIFPGNYSVWFTGLGWYYEDGRQTQRIGIVPDIKVDYTLLNQFNHTDPIMQRALELIRTGK
jgi:carboxyl-terminal processing protease